MNIEIDFDRFGLRVRAKLKIEGTVFVSDKTMEHQEAVRAARLSRRSP